MLQLKWLIYTIVLDKGCLPEAGLAGIFLVCGVWVSQNGEAPVGRKCTAAALGWAVMALTVGKLGICLNLETQDRRGNA